MCDTNNNTNCIEIKTQVDTLNCFDFSIITSMLGTDTSSTPITEATVSEFLTLCNSTITIKDLCCFRNANALIIGIPLTVSLDKCNTYKISPPEIPSEDYSNNVIVLVGNDETPRELNLQVSNGYLYIIVRIDPVTDVEQGDNGCCNITLNFTKFIFALNKIVVYCNNNTPCKPVTFEFGVIDTSSSTTTSSTTTTLPIG